MYFGLFKKKRNSYEYYAPFQEIERELSYFHPYITVFSLHNHLEIEANKLNDFL
ncbi:hypothetical protein B4144_4324 [Bacillus atrophaeus]|nr:hypothetical protein B4144_4324 [Bacillus atrophaeus]